MKKVVLLVDDEEIVRLTSGEILEELGLQVITAASGNEALDILKAGKENFSLIILDMTLPDYSGIDLFNEIKKINSDLKFLLTSGYRQDMSGAAGDLMFIQKPYTISELSGSLKKLI